MLSTVDSANMKNIENDMLYHATYAHYVRSIFENGLGAPSTSGPHENSETGKASETGESSKTCKNYPDSAPGVVYLASSPEIAESYAEAAIDDENTHLPESWLDQIVILEVNIDLIDEDSLFPDRNVIDGLDTFEYHGIIPPEAICIHERYMNNHYSI
jgi:hypothetical protein